ncbi:uncharacterized protein LOC109285659 [Alligator mississippiensis]|uniref:uncharacterized protein LOC109285659 n=1 Tax=Alligator mississippiensis TaxID=8496 RepID=UPI0028774724|nr:uncharacterized protein LOC109285659 [Alligator mississippiensis]
MGDFNYPDIWEERSVKSKWSQSFLSCVDYLCLTQETYGPTRDKALRDLVLATEDDLISDLTIDGKLGDSDHELITFTICRKADKSVSNTETDLPPILSARWQRPAARQQPWISGAWISVRLNSLDLGAWFNSAKVLDTMDLGAWFNSAKVLNSLDLGAWFNSAKVLDTMDLGAWFNSAKVLNSLDLGAWFNSAKVLEAFD